MPEIMRINPFGVNYDQPPHMLGPDVWTAGENIIFEDSRTRKSKGFQAIDPPPLYTPLDLIYTDGAGADMWVYVGRDGVGMWDGVAHFDLTPAGWITPGPTQFPTLCLINNVVVMNNPAIDPQWWDLDTLGVFVPLPGWDQLPGGFATFCDMMNSNLYHLFALNMSEDGLNFAGNRVRWSDAAAPGSVPGAWEPLVTNQAGFIDLATPGGDIIGGQTLRENFVVYKENSTHLFQYVGGTFVYDVHTLFESQGMLAKNCVVELDGTHVVITHNDIVIHDGNTVQSIADKVVKHEFFESLNQSLSHLCFVHLDRTSEQLYFGYPDLAAVQGCNNILIYCYTDKTWTKRSFTEEFYSIAVGKWSAPGIAGVTWDGMTIPNWQEWTGRWDYAATTAAENQHIMGSETQLFALLPITNDDGSPITSTVSKTGMDLGMIDERKRLSRVWPKFEEGRGNTVNISVGSSEFALDQPVWSPPVPFLIGTDRSIPCDVEGRAIAFKIEDDGSAPTWSLTGLEFEFRVAGKY